MSPTENTASKGRSTPVEPRTAPRSLGGIVLLLVGAALTAGGLAMTLGPRYAPGMQLELRWYARVLSDMGIQGDALAMGGTVLFGLGLVTRYIRQTLVTTLQPGMATQLLEEIRADVAQVQHGMQDLNVALVEQGVKVGSIKKEFGEHRDEVRSKDSNDALFRLAASLDQLGARIDKRIGEATADLQEGIYEVSSVVEASRDVLTQGFEDVTQQFGDQMHDALQDSGVDDECPPSEETMDSRSSYVDSLTADDEAGDLRVVVDLEEVQPEPEPEPELQSLGLLDQLDDVGSLSSSPADEASERAPSFFSTPPTIDNVAAEPQAPLPAPANEESQTPSSDQLPQPPPY